MKISKKKLIKEQEKTIHRLETHMVFWKIGCLALSILLVIPGVYAVFREKKTLPVSNREVIQSDSLIWDSLPKIPLPVTSEYFIRDTNQKQMTFSSLNNDSLSIHLRNFYPRQTIRQNVITLHATDSLVMYVNWFGVQYTVQFRMDSIKGVIQEEPLQFYNNEKINQK